jgi:tryptophan-rich sensory protein
MEKTRHIIGLVLCLVICFAAAGIGSLYTIPSISTWYVLLPKPAWTPPNWVFGPVWTVLYLLMAIAAWLVWRQRGSVRAAAAPLALFTIQLILNVGWSIVFFGQHLPGIGLLVIIFLWLAILATLIACWRVAPLAGWLLLPYLLWVSYASALNYAIWRAVLL